MSGAEKDWTLPMGWPVPAEGAPRYVLVADPGFWMELSVTAEGGMRQRCCGDAFARDSGRILDWVQESIESMREELGV